MTKGIKNLNLTCILCSVDSMTEGFPLPATRSQVRGGSTSHTGSMSCSNVLAHPSCQKPDSPQCQTIQMKPTCLFTILAQIEILAFLVLFLVTIFSCLFWELEDFNCMNMLQSSVPSENVCSLDRM